MEPWLTQDLQVPARADRAEPQASGRTYVFREVTVAQWRQVGGHRTGVFMWVLGHAERDVSPV